MLHPLSSRVLSTSRQTGAQRQIHPPYGMHIHTLSAESRSFSKSSPGSSAPGRLLC
jgi:hypothetical protein